KVFAVAAEGHVRHAAGVTRHPANLLAGFEIPELDQAAGRPRGQLLPVGGNGQPPDAPRHRVETANFGPLFQLPHLDNAARAGDALLAAGEEGDALDERPAQLHGANILARLNVPQANRSVRRTGEDAPAVRGEHRTFDRPRVTEKLPDFADLHVEGSGDRRGTCPARCHDGQALLQTDLRQAGEVGDGLAVPEGGTFLQAVLCRRLLLLRQVPPGVAQLHLFLAR